MYLSFEQSMNTSLIMNCDGEMACKGTLHWPDTEENNEQPTYSNINCLTNTSETPVCAMEMYVQEGFQSDRIHLNCNEWNYYSCIGSFYHCGLSYNCFCSMTHENDGWICVGNCPNLTAGNGTAASTIFPTMIDPSSTIDSIPCDNSKSTTMIATTTSDSTPCNQISTTMMATTMMATTMIATTTSDSSPCNQVSTTIAATTTTDSTPCNQISTTMAATTMAATTTSDSSPCANKVTDTESTYQKVKSKSQGTEKLTSEITSNNAKVSDYWNKKVGIFIAIIVGVLFFGMFCGCLFMYCRQKRSRQRIIGGRNYGSVRTDDIEA
jgi:hypothetical protein